MTTETRWLFFGEIVVETTITNRGAVVDEWVRSLATRRRPGADTVVGLDCEWRPSMIRGVNNRTAVLQLCVGRKCIIIQLMYLDYIPESLRAFLASREVVVAGVEVDKDVEKLWSENGLRCARTADVRELALWKRPHKFVRSRSPGLKQIAWSVLGLDMPKPPHVTCSDWQRSRLDDEQIEYACLDAFASYGIASVLLTLD